MENILLKIGFFIIHHSCLLHRESFRCKKVCYHVVENWECGSDISSNASRHTIWLNVMNNFLFVQHFNKHCVFDYIGNATISELKKISSCQQLVRFIWRTVSYIWLDETMHFCLPTLKRNDCLHLTTHATATILLNTKARKLYIFS